MGIGPGQIHSASQHPDQAKCILAPWSKQWTRNGPSTFWCLGHIFAMPSQVHSGKPSTFWRDKNSIVPNAFWHLDRSKRSDQAKYILASWSDCCDVSQVHSGKGQVHSGTGINTNLLNRTRPGQVHSGTRSKLPFKPSQHRPTE